VIYNFPEKVFGSLNFVNFIKFILMYFIIFEVIVNGIISQSVYCSYIGRLLISGY
jgi:hypothetical protein